MSGVGSNNARGNGAPVGIQAILETGHCRSLIDVWRQSIPRSGRTYNRSRFPPGKMKTWLTDLEVVPSEVTCSWRFKELLRSQVQVTVEQLVHRDMSSTEKVSLHRGITRDQPRSGQLPQPSLRHIRRALITTLKNDYS